jgi:Domain of unknown function (DUF1707)
MRRRLRASDAEREAVIGQLDQALSDGRITVSEFDERVRLAWAARTLGDLEGLTGDLPQILW